MSPDDTELLPFEQPIVSFRRRDLTTRVIIHESHTPAGDRPRAVDVLRARGRANGLLEIGYHFVIERNGHTIETRHFAAMGSHAPGCNHDSIGICLSADAQWRSEDHPRQLISLLKVYRTVSLVYERLPVFGHDEVMRRRDRTHKCPSFDMDWVRDYLGAPNAT